MKVLISARCRLGLIKNDPTELGVFLGALLYSGALHYWLKMDAFWDTAHYHYFIGWAAVHLSPYKYGAVALENTFLNPLIDSMNYLTFGSSSYLGAAMHSVFLAFSVVLVYKIGLKAISGGAADLDSDVAYKNGFAIVACVIGGTAAMTVSLFGSLTNEHITAAFVLLSLLVAMNCLQRPDSRWLVIVSGTFAGIAAALKLTAAPYAIALWISFACLSRRSIRVLFLFACGLGIGYLALEGPFMALRWSEYRNPLFPFANQVFQSPYYPPIGISYGLFELKNLGLYLTLPARWLYSGVFSDEPSVRDGRILLAFIGLFAYLIGRFAWRQEQRNESLLVLLFFLGSWILWILIFRTYRYIVVLELLSGIIFVSGILRLRLISKQRKSASLLLLIIVTTFLGITTVYPHWGRRPWQNEFAKATFPFPLKAGDLVFFADLRLSYLAPLLIDRGANVAGFFSQPWILPGSRKGPTDPAPTPLPDVRNIYVMQYNREDPRGKSSFFANLTVDRLLVCREVSTNMLWNPVACHFFLPDEVPALQVNKEYSYQSESLLFLLGWSVSASAPRSSELSESSLVLRLPATQVHQCSIIHFEGDIFGDGDQIIEAAVSGNRKLTKSFSSVAQFDIAIRPEEIDKDGLVTINFRFPLARSPNSNDRRLLAFRFKSLRILPSCS